MDDFKDLIELFVLISQESSSISTDLVFTIKDLERYQLLVQEIKNKNQSYDDTLSNTEIKIVSAIPPGLHIYADFESYNNRVKEEFFKETILILSHDPEPIIISTVNNTKIAKYYYSGAEDIRLLNRYYLFIIIHFLESICD